LHTSAFAALALFCAATVAAQPRISPRIAARGSSSYVIVFREGADMDRARDALASRGFDVLSHPDLRPNHILAGGPQARLSSLDDLEDFAYALPASTDLLMKRRVLACGGAVEEGGAGLYVLAGRGWPADPGGGVALRFAFASFPPKLEEGSVRSEIERGLREWERYANLVLTAGTDPAASRTIAIRFAAGAHGDAYPFDGRGGMLAHTFYPAPTNSEPLAGDMHLDAQEDWHIGISVDLFTVALHEAGHALGLAHSDQPGAVMYPYYRQAYGLTSDDIAAIQDLYGVHGAPAPPTPQPPPVTTPPPPITPPPATPPVTTPPPVGASPDRTPPSLRITTPSTAVVSTTAATISIAGSASDDTGVTSVRWSTSLGDSGAASGTTSWTASVPLYPGANVITVRAFDAAGNSGWRSITVSRR
jgi:hypothetical protein